MQEGAAVSRDPILNLSSPWTVEMRSGLFGRQKQLRTVAFYASGAVVFDDGERGEWTCANDCASWTTKRDDVALQYNAIVHENSFGDRPHLTQGVVTRDRRGKYKRLFRPVIASFTAKGQDFD